MRPVLVRAVHRYFELVQSRNKKISEHDSLIVGIQDAARQYYEQSLRIEEFADMKAQLVNNQKIPEKLAYVEAIKSTQDSQLDVMRRVVWNEKRAQAFWQLDPRLLSDSSLVSINLINSAADLLNAHNGVLTQREAYLIDEHPGITQFDPSGHSIRINLNDGDRESFSATRRMRFSIGFEDGTFQQHMKEIFVTGIQVVMLPQASAFAGRLVHSGIHRFENVAGKRVEFCSYPTFIGIESGEMLTFKDILGDGDQRIHGLSPFSDWTLIADESVPISLLGHLEAITLTFMGNSRASTQ